MHNGWIGKVAGFVLSTIGLCAASGAAWAQSPPKSPSPRAFDSASIKPNTSGSGGFSMGTSHGRLTATNVPVQTLIEKAFLLKEFQVSGGPGWLARRGTISSRRLTQGPSATTICGFRCSRCSRIGFT